MRCVHWVHVCYVHMVCAVDAVLNYTLSMYVLLLNPES